MHTKILVTALTLSLGLTGCSVQSSISNTAGNSQLNNSEIPVIDEANPEPFLDKKSYPYYYLCIPTPPEDNSFEFERDKKIYKETRSLKNSQIWNDARTFATYDPRYISLYFSKETGLNISKESTPWTYYLITRVYRDAKNGGTKPTKQHYHRIRPFVYYNERTCSTIEDDRDHINSGSYPSAHSAYGNLVALILSEIVPSKQVEIIKAGQKFGYYRVVCGFHWQSDIEAAALISGYVNSRLHTNSDFLRALEMAKKEVNNLTSPKN
ncbi:acid phosphatase [Succinivibrio dextrinosolvens]|uniref:acid phosphatase n=1 Tax=Succinivibrio dextrinosolvens TaxID=83771 RepID=UPI0019240173|nr:phosphatase PAP2 family protein [Succinivibrio dextrinosolvens]